VRDNVGARLLLARAYYHSAQLSRAEEQLRLVLERDPCDAYAHLMLGRTLQRLGRPEDARGNLRLASAMDPALAEFAVVEP
jgi:Tfp pilus assembly protein PilF